MGVTTATKENRKGYARSFHYRRRPVVVASCAACLLALAACLTWWLLRAVPPAKNEDKLAAEQPLKEDKDVIVGERAGTVATRPLHNIVYGVRSTPLVMIQSSLDPQLHERFLEEHLYSCLEADLNQIPELDKRVKAPTFVYEGYYHSLPTENKVYSMNPNPLIGHDFNKPAASQFTRAFYDAFRQVNKEIWDTLKQNLMTSASQQSTNTEEDVCFLLAQWIEKGFHFGDLSVQIHYGQGNEAKLISGAAWHTDAENSLLHFAVTLRGSRVLHSKREVGAQGATLRRAKSQKVTEVQEKQNPGDVYLSSSTLMRHAPQFFDTDYLTRVIAIHARILYTSADINHFRRIRTKESWERLTRVLADTLAAADLQIPSLAQVNSRLLLLPNQ